ncbi:hypothetical protein ACFORO_05865 [Amycolatopsis halotolerans]|uniref:Tat pathway signal sequence domain protein n=1 Tax=Amycolatopsis halotolerans TaxID=330083 RepID=A0ABV7Q994_9PSEU
MSSLSRRTLVLTAAVLTGAAVLTSGVASSATESASPSCGAATLRGTYLFSGDGWTITGATATPLAFAGSERFDGAGHVQGVSSTNANGTPSSHNAFTGVYTVAADCTGTLVIGGSLHFDLYLDPSGDSFAYVQTDPGAVSATTEHRATRT